MRKKKGFIFGISIIGVVILIGIISIILFINRPILDVRESVMVEVGSILSLEDMVVKEENISAIKILPEIRRNDTYDEAIYANVSLDGQEFSAGYNIGSYIVTIEAEGESFGRVKKEIVINVYVNSQDDLTESPSKKEFSFASAEEVDNISDEDLVMIASGNYTREDFFEEGEFATIDLFDIPMVKLSEEYYAYPYEDYRIEVLNTNTVGENYDVNSILSADFIREYGMQYVADIMDAQNTREPGEATGTLVKDEEIIYCGETDFYVEYSGRYTDSRSLYSNDVLVTHNISRADRFVFLTTFLIRSDNGGQLLLLGELSKDYVQEQLDYYLYDRYDKMLYREVTEEEDCYVYTYYYVGMCYGDYGINDEVILYKEILIIDKETHIISFDCYNVVKEIVIQGSARDYPEEW